MFILEKFCLPLSQFHKYIEKSSKIKEKWEATSDISIARKLILILTNISQSGGKIM